MNGLMRFWHGFKHGRQRQREINRARQTTALGILQRSESEEAPDNYSRVKDLIENYKYKALLLTQEELDRYVSGGVVTLEDWQELRSLGDREEREARLKKARRELEDAVRNDVISRFIHQNFENGMVATAQATLRPEINTLLHEGKEIELSNYLCNVLRLGLEGARKKKEKIWRGGWVGESGWQFGGAYWGLLWEALSGLFRVAITLGVLLAAHSKFETIVFALLLLIVNGVWDLLSSRPALLLASEAHLHDESKRLRRLLNDEPPDEVQESDARDDREFQKMQKRFMLQGYIRGAFAFIAWLIVIVNLLLAIL
jgi:hypothetical protein